MKYYVMLWALMVVFNLALILSINQSEERRLRELTITSGTIGTSISVSAVTTKEIRAYFGPDTDFATGKMFFSTGGHWYTFRGGEWVLEDPVVLDLSKIPRIMPRLKSEDSPFQIWYGSYKRGVISTGGIPHIQIYNTFPEIDCLQRYRDVIIHP